MRNPYIILDVETGIEENNCSGPGGNANPYAGVPLVAVGWKVKGHQTVTEYWDGRGRRPYQDVLFEDMKHCSKQGCGPVIIVGHNINFDLHHVFFEQFTEQLMEWDCDFTIWDTQTVEYLLSGQLTKSPKLVDLENKYLGGEGRRFAKDEMHNLFEAGIGADKIDRRKLDTYLRDDVDQTELVFLAQFQKAYQLGMSGFIREMMDAQLLAFLMEKEGWPINTDIIPEIVSASEVELGGAKENLNQLLSKLFVDDTSHLDGVTNQQLAKMLVGEPIEVKWKEENGVFKTGQRAGQIKYSWRTQTMECNIPPIDVRELQGIKAPQLPSVAEKKLDQIAANLPEGLWKEVFSAVLDVRKAEKKCNTYAKGYLSKVCPDDSRLRTSINSSITATNRVSSSNPNLQNLPGDM